MSDENVSPAARLMMAMWMSVSHVHTSDFSGGMVSLRGRVQAVDVLSVTLPPSHVGQENPRPGHARAINVTGSMYERRKRLPSSTPS